MFDVTDSSGSQIKLHQISRDNCVSRVVAMSNEKEQSKKDAKTGDGTKADNMLSVRMAEYAEEKKQLWRMVSKSWHMHSMDHYTVIKNSLCEVYMRTWEMQTF